MTTMANQLRDALADAGARRELADEAVAAVIHGAARCELATKGDIAEPKAEPSRAMLLQTLVTIGVIVTLLKLLLGACRRSACSGRRAQGVSCSERRVALQALAPEVRLHPGLRRRARQLQGRRQPRGVVERAGLDELEVGHGRHE